jgi:hypothetical protein
MGSTADKRDRCQNTVVGVAQVHAARRTLCEKRRRSNNCQEK